MKVICPNCQAENDTYATYCTVCEYKLSTDQENKTIEKTIAGDKIKKKPTLKTAIISGIAFIVMYSVTHFFTKSLFKPSIEKQMNEIVAEFNKECPMNVDEYTILQSVTLLPGQTVQYNYIILGATKADFNIDTANKYIFSSILQDVKTKPGMQWFRDNKVTLNYNYIDTNKNFVTQYTVTPAMYQ